MDVSVVNVAVAGVLGAHGIGHLLGWMPAAGLARFEGVSSGSWALTGPVGEGVARMIAVGLFAVPTVGFLVAAAGLLMGQPWWRSVAIAAAAVSLAATALYPQALPASSTVGSLAVNGIVLAGILVAGWGASSAAA